VSYGTCRYQFTNCQKARIRCFQAQYLAFLKEDTNPVQYPGESKIPVPANPNTGTGICAGWTLPFPCPFAAASSSTFSIVGILIMLMITLFY
jgi:hypothetical protein